MDSNTIKSLVAANLSREEIAVVDMGTQAAHHVRLWSQRGRRNGVWDSTPFQNAGTDIQNIANWLHSQGGAPEQIATVGDDGSYRLWYVEYPTVEDGAAESEDTDGDPVVSQGPYVDLEDEHADEVVRQLGIDLIDYSSEMNADGFAEVEWVHDAEPDRVWKLSCYALRIGTRCLIWTDTDEAGVADLDWVEAWEDIDEQCQDYAEDIASGLGELVEAE